MLNSFLPNKEQRYAIAGSAVGAMAPVMMFAGDITTNPGLMRIAEQLSHNPLYSAVFLAPLVLGWVFSAEGRRQDRMAAELVRERAAIEKLTHTAFHDALTGLPNRHALNQDISAILSADQAGPRLPVILLLDLDRFKFINDSMGHDAGDEVLMALTRRLRGVCGASRKIYRLGGDEFVIFWNGAPTRADVERFAGDLAETVFQPVAYAGSEIATGGSVGITFMTCDDATMSGILKRADLALYQAKEVQGNSHCFFTAAMDKDFRLRRGMENAMRAGLGTAAFRLDYQPVIEAATLAATTFQVKIRWSHPTHGDVAPEVFLPMAEKTGLIVLVGQWMLRQALSDAARWPASVGLHVDISAQQLTQPGFVNDLAALLAQFDIAPKRLTLGIAADALHAGHIRQTRLELHRLRSTGIVLALRDFGTGEVSLKSLRLAMLDQVQIDLGVLRSACGQRLEASLAKPMTELAASLGLPVVFDGVDTAADLEFVSGLGVKGVTGLFVGGCLTVRQVVRFHGGLVGVTETRPRQAALKIAASR